jgi:hypothetical protein
MNRLAFFVEGYTELLFVEKLIQEMAGKSNVRIESRRIRGGTTIPRSSIQIKAVQPDTGQRYYVLIVDCGNDKQVKSRIMEEHGNLTRKGYSKIIGLRDVRPDFTYADIRNLESGLRTYIKTKLIPVQFVLAVMEIEAWFLAESSHFARIDPAITVETILATLGFDPVNDDMEKRLTPTEDLNNCYAIAGKQYQKGASDTVDAIDYNELCLNTINRFSHLKNLVENIEVFLTSS